MYVFLVFVVCGVYVFGEYVYGYDFINYKIIQVKLILKMKNKYINDELCCKILNFIGWV